MPDMFRIAAGFMLPHPPVIIPGVSRSPHKAAATVTAIRELAGEFAALRPETVVVISPHAPLFSDYIYFYDQPELSGSFQKFGAPQARLSFRQDDELCHDLIARLDKAGLPGGSLTPAQMSRHQLDAELDHGVLVPLWYLHEAWPEFRLVALSCSGLSLPQIYQAGELIRQSAAMLNRRVVIVASGDQSHKVNEESPYGACPEGSAFDDLLTGSLRRGDLRQALSIDSRLREKAAECGYRSLVMMLGAFNRQAVRTAHVSYEAPYGIGYCTAWVIPDMENAEPVEDVMQAALARQRKAANLQRAHSSPPVMIARETLEAHVLGAKAKNARDFADLQDADFLFSSKAGAFVSLKKFGDLRGCIGTTGPTTASLAEEIIQNAISAGCRDPRFEPVTADELPDLVYSVDVLNPPEPVTGKNQLNPSVYGVIVRRGGKSGLLLPDLEGIDTVEEQLAIACRKAGISQHEDYTIQRFTVTRYT